LAPDISVGNEPVGHPSNLPRAGSKGKPALRKYEQARKVCAPVVTDRNFIEVN
jgi:hypothetical protein